MSGGHVSSICPSSGFEARRGQAPLFPSRVALEARPSRQWARPLLPGAATPERPDSASGSSDCGNPEETTEKIFDGEILKKMESSESISSVRVVVRFRPPVTHEEKNVQRAFILRPGDSVIDSYDRAYTFELHRVFGENCTQATLFQEVGQPIIDDVLHGYNGTILAYGQTGGGKTYCMLGPDMYRAELQGVIPRAASQIFELIRTTDHEETEFYLRCSFLEVHKEQLVDLLDPTNQNLKIKELPQKGIFVDGLTQEFAICETDILQTLRDGARRRAAACTRLNQHSSRSHAIFTLHCEQKAPDGSEMLGKLNLADLAGTEKVSKSGAVGGTLEEAKKINMGLLALGNVIDALTEQRPHVPYRDSRLTRILQETLGGNCKTALVVACSSSVLHYDETLSSLRFATRAKAVRNRAKLNFIRSADQWMMIVEELRRELIAANKQIASLCDFKEKALDTVPEELHRRQMSAPILERHMSAPSLGQIGTRMPPTFTPPTPSHGTSDPQLSKFCSKSTFSAGFSDCETHTPPPDDVQSSSCDDGSRRPTQMGNDGASKDAENWRQIAESGQAVIQEMEAALLAQERALQQAQALKSDRGSAPTCPRDVLAARTEAVQHAADARRLNWRLKVSEHRSEMLKIQLELQKKHSDDLKLKLEEVISSRAGIESDPMKESNKHAALPCRLVGAAPPCLPDLNLASLPVPFSPPLHRRLRNSRGAKVLRPVSRRSPRSRREALAGTGEEGVSTDDISCPVDGTGSTGESQHKPMSHLQVDEQWLRASVESLQRSQIALQDDNERLQGQLDFAKTQVADLMSEADAREVQFISLRHEILAKDALMDHLNTKNGMTQDVDDRDNELEDLLGQVISHMTRLLDAPGNR